MCCGEADLVGGDRFEEVVFLIGEIEAEAVEFIEGAGHGEVAEVLAGDFFLAEDFGFGSMEFGVGEALGGEQLGFQKEFMFHELGVFGGSAGVEGEVAGEKAREILSANVVSKAETLANPEEEAGTEVAAGFLDEFEGEAMGMDEGGAWEPDHDHGLYFIAVILDARLG